MKNKKILLRIEIILIFIGIFIFHTNVSLAENFIDDTEESAKDYIYLSDISYVKKDSFAANEHTIRLDKNDSNGLIYLKQNGESTPFIKGICAWATSEIVYDLSKYNYDYFTSYLGVDISEQSTYFNTGVRFYIYTSEDGENWENKLQTDALYGWSEAIFVKVDIKNANYLKLVADDNSNNWWANWYDEAVYANAKLIKESYEEDTSGIDALKTVAEYDEIIKSYEDEQIVSDYELTLLQREFVNNVGYNILQAFVKCSEEYKNTIFWIMNDEDNLRLYIIGGKPSGNYLESLKVLAQLYNTYKGDLTNENITENGVKLKDLYRKMMISLSLTHSKTVRFWINDRIPDENGTITTNSDENSPNVSNAVTRYEIYKQMHLDGKLNNNIFEQLEVEEMRYIMCSDIPDDEIKWLRDYTEQKGSINPYSYLKYTTTVSYWNEKYYSAENKDSWNDKYNFLSYGIDYKSYYPRLWIVFEEGGVCWQISNTGQNINSSYGIPSTTVGQPGHVAYLVYSLNNNGDGMWNLWNDVSGWTKTNAAGYSNHVSYYNIRWMNDWGSGSYASPYMGSYILLAQAAINDFENYEKSEETLLLANTYSDDIVKLEEIYRKALEIQNINFDAWYGLVNLYANDNTKTDEELYKLADELTSSLKYYPLPMYDLLRIIFDKIESTEYNVKLTLLQTRTLTEASQATEQESIQANIVRIMAKYLLGQMDDEIATFSFDGENAGVLSLSNRYDGSNATWDYSLDGGNNWTLVTEHSKKLTEDEINSITSENDIKVHIIGVDYSEDNIFTIDIKESAGLPSNLYANDLENKIIAAIPSMEWKFNEEDEWTSYGVAEPDLTGDKTVLVRLGKTGLYLPSDATNYTFTEDNQSDNRKYISISHLSIHQVSSEATANGGHAVNAIDGNINTAWHTAYNGSDSQRYISIELDEPVYLSALEYVPRQSGSNGRIKNGNLFVSMDGENWTEVATISNWANNASTKIINLDKSVETKYVKLVATANYGDGRTFASALMINLFKDITEKTTPTAEIEYDITDLTNQNVTARLINPSSNITITNNNGNDSYVFEENGEFIFEFVNDSGIAGSATAKVTWIDKETPVATVEYSTTELTSGDVVVTLKCDEEIIITNNDGKETYTFTENGSFEFIYQDKAGNEGRTRATVDWIDKEAPMAYIEYSITELTNQNVMVTLKCDEEIIILNNDGKTTYTFEENGEFTFEYEDKIGNNESITAKVSWIDKEVPVATVEYNISELTNKDVIATLKSNEEIIITNNEGKATYTFTENGSFEFIYHDKAGNEGRTTVTVDWIDKEVPLAIVEYSTTEQTSESVIATLKCDEEITILNNDGKTDYTFKENGSFEFVYQDKAGNEGKTTAKVDWIISNPKEDEDSKPDDDNNNKPSDDDNTNTEDDSNQTNNNTVNNNTTNNNTVNNNTTNNNTVNNNTTNSNTVNNNTTSNNTTNNNTTNNNAINNNITINNTNKVNSTSNKTIVIGATNGGNQNDVPATGDIVPVIALSIMFITVIVNIIQIIFVKKKLK